jgi:hypothetical protein
MLSHLHALELNGQGSSRGHVLYLQERTPALERYLRIAATLPTKGVRDVALRVRWMQRFAQQKRRVSCKSA